MEYFSLVLLVILVLEKDNINLGQANKKLALHLHYRYWPICNYITIQGPLVYGNRICTHYLICSLCTRCLGCIIHKSYVLSSPLFQDVLQLPDLCFLESIQHATGVEDKLAVTKSLLLSIVTQFYRHEKCNNNKNVQIRTIWIEDPSR